MQNSTKKSVLKKHEIISFNTKITKKDLKSQDLNVIQKDVVCFAIRLPNDK